MDSEFVINLDDVSISYDNKPVLWDITLSIPKAKLVGIVGPNGAGKSSLIKAIMGIIPLSSGNIQLLNKDIKHARTRVAYIPQRESIDWDFPISVLDVVLMGLYPKLGLFKQISKSDKKIAIEALDKVNMSNYITRQISDLSGGQQQRVFIARALAQNSDILLMDEPFSGVDMTTQTIIINTLKDLVKNGKTILVVHHDLQTVIDYFDWLILLNMRLIAADTTKNAFTIENLQETYGGQLGILSRIAQIVKDEEFPLREK